MEIITLSSDNNNQTKGNEKKIISIKDKYKINKNELTKKRSLPNAEENISSKKRIKLITLSENVNDTSTLNKAELNESIKDREKEEKIQLIISSMKECQVSIKKYDKTEVDWENDGNSNYIKGQKYKEQMIQLYNELCELTGEHKDANRLYLKPKNFKLTKIESIDTAINNFINQKLKNQPDDNAYSIDSFIFPNYLDILNCIEKCNNQENLSMTNETMESLAKSTFEDLGKALKKERQSDYFDTFSMLWDDENHHDDPAKITPDLLEKLENNRKIGNENMKKMLDNYVVKHKEEEEKKAKANGNNVKDNDKEEKDKKDEKDKENKNKDKKEEKKEKEEKEKEEEEEEEKEEKEEEKVEKKEEEEKKEEKKKKIFINSDGNEIFINYDEKKLLYFHKTSKDENKFIKIEITAPNDD